jgi:hypothetical protein
LNFQIVDSNEYSRILNERNSQNNNSNSVTFLKCDISGAPIRSNQGDEAIRIFVPTTTTKATSASKIPQHRFDRAKKERTSKKDVEMIVDRDVWLFFVRHCMQK